MPTGIPVSKRSLAEATIISRNVHIFAKNYTDVTVIPCNVVSSVLTGS